MTADEHGRIIASEKNIDRRAFYASLGNRLFPEGHREPARRSAAVEVVLRYHDSKGTTINAAVVAS